MPKKNKSKNFKTYDLNSFFKTEKENKTKNKSKSIKKELSRQNSNSVTKKIQTQEVIEKERIVQPAIENKRIEKKVDLQKTSKLDTSHGKKEGE